MVAARGYPIPKAGGFYAIQSLFGAVQRSAYSFLGFGPHLLSFSHFDAPDLPLAGVVLNTLAADLSPEFFNRVFD
jgi:hypothetical protein